MRVGAQPLHPAAGGRAAERMRLRGDEGNGDRGVIRTVNRTSVSTERVRRSRKVDATAQRKGRQSAKEFNNRIRASDSVEWRDNLILQSSTIDLLCDFASSALSC